MTVYWVCKFVRITCHIGDFRNSLYFSSSKSWFNSLFANLEADLWAFAIICVLHVDYISNCCNKNFQQCVVLRVQCSPNKAYSLTWNYSSLHTKNWRCQQYLWNVEKCFSFLLHDLILRTSKVSFKIVKYVWKFLQAVSYIFGI